MGWLLMACLVCSLTLASFSLGGTKVDLWERRIPRHSGHEVREDGDCLANQLQVPKGCSSAAGECTVVLSWELLPEGKELLLAITADLSEAGGVTKHGSWAAVGFSPDGRMAKSDALECLFHASGNVSILDGWNTKDSQNTVDPDQSDITFLNGSVKGESGHCRFKRAIVPKDTLHSYNLNRTWHLLFAIGPLKGGESEEGATPLSHHKWTWNGAEGVNLLSPCVSPSATDEQSWRAVLIRVHGSLMLFVFLVLFPMGALLARYFKEIVGKKWIYIHMGIMISAAVAMIVSFGFALGHTSLEFHVGVHQIIGIIVLPLAPLQVIIGFLRPSPEPLTTSTYVFPTYFRAFSLYRRKVFNWAHRCLGCGILSVGFLLCYLGIGLLEDDDSGAKPWIYTSLTVCLLVHLLVLVLIEYLQWKSAYDKEYQRVSWKAEDDSSEEDSGVDIGRRDITTSVHYMLTLNKWIIAMLFLALGQGILMATIASGLLFYHL